MKVDSGVVCDKNGNHFYYEVLEDGYKIYKGNTDYPSYHQYEPYIPDHTLTYEENAINDCKLYQYVNPESLPKPFVMTEELYNKQQSDIDFLMLMTDSSIM